MAGPSLRFWAVWAVVLLSLSKTDGQGYKPPPATMGTSSKQEKLDSLLKRSREYVNSWSRGGRTTCKKGGKAALCAPASTTESDRQSAMLVAMSPAAFSSANLSDTGGIRVLPAAVDQGECDSCTALAVTAAAQTALATALRKSVRDVPALSAQDLYFCGGAADTRGCNSGWGFVPGAVADLIRRQRQLLTQACLPYDPIVDPLAPNNDAFCRKRCSDTLTLQGAFTSRPVSSLWEAQQQIRTAGAVVTSFEIFSDLQAFFDPADAAQRVYKPAANATFVVHHAIVLVGYVNDGDSGHWIALNSRGPYFADNGLFRIAYGCCGILNDAHGITWQPNSITSATVLQPRAPAGQKDCFYYVAKQGDWLSKIAQQGNVRLEQLLLDNVDQLDDLSRPIVGKKLLVCPQGAWSSAAPSTAAPQATQPAAVGPLAPALQWTWRGQSYQLYKRALTWEWAEDSCRSLGSGATLLP